MDWWVPGQIHPRVGGYQKLDSLDCFGLVGLIKMLAGSVVKKTVQKVLDLTSNPHNQKSRSESAQSGGEFGPGPTNP